MTKGAAWAFPVERAGVRVGGRGAMDQERIRFDSYDSQRSTELGRVFCFDRWRTGLRRFSGGSLGDGGRFRWWCRRVQWNGKPRVREHLG